METLPQHLHRIPILLYLPSITPEPTPTALDPAQVPETAALELVLSAADLYEPYLFLKQREKQVPENESLLVLKELYSLRLAGDHLRRPESGMTIVIIPEPDWQV